MNILRNGPKGTKDINMKVVTIKNVIHSIIEEIRCFLYILFFQFKFFWVPGVIFVNTLASLFKEIPYAGRMWRSYGKRTGIYITLFYLFFVIFAIYQKVPLRQISVFNTSGYIPPAPFEVMEIIIRTILLINNKLSNIPGIIFGGVLFFVINRLGVFNIIYNVITFALFLFNISEAFIKAGVKYPGLIYTLFPFFIFIFTLNAKTFFYMIIKDEILEEKKYK